MDYINLKSHAMPCRCFSKFLWKRQPSTGTWLKQADGEMLRNESYNPNFCTFKKGDILFTQIFFLGTALKIPPKYY